MRRHTPKYLLPLLAILVCAFFFRLMPVPCPVSAEPPNKPSSQDNEELSQLFREDQDDRKAANVDWSIVGPRDRKREARVKEFYQNNRLQTGADYYHAAMVLQHGQTPEDFLLAHELCIVAISKGEEPAKWLAAASEDRFLMVIGRAQRFGTQYQREEPNGPRRRYKVEPGVTDELRRALNVPPLNEAGAAKGNEKLEKAKNP